MGKVVNITRRTEVCEKYVAGAQQRNVAKVVAAARAELTLTPWQRALKALKA